MLQIATICKNESILTTIPNDCQNIPTIINTELSKIDAKLDETIIIISIPVDEWSDILENTITQLHGDIHSRKILSIFVPSYVGITIFKAGARDKIIDSDISSENLKFSNIATEELNPSVTITSSLKPIEDFDFDKHVLDILNNIKDTGIGVAIKFSCEDQFIINVMEGLRPVMEQIEAIGVSILVIPDTETITIS